MSKGKHSNKKNNKILSNILIILFTGILIYSLYKIILWNVNNKKNDNISNEIANFIEVSEEENKQEYTVDFKKLKEKNSDTVAWLKVNGTKIEYAVVKTSNNDYYLKHNLNKEYNPAGWIFADYKNKVDGTDKNLVIYGHNMRNNSMFGSLKDVIKEKWYNNEENKYVILVTEEKTYTYEVFSVYQIEKETYYVKTNFNSKEEYSNFIQTIKSRSKKDFKVNINANDKILTLSTCANNNKYRVVLHAKLIES